MDNGAAVRDTEQQDKMAQTKAEDRINDGRPLTYPYPIFGAQADLLRSRNNNVIMGSAIAEGDDPSHHSFESDTPNHGAQASQTLFSNSSSGVLAITNPITTSTASTFQASSSTQPSGILVNTPALSMTNIPVNVSSATPSITQGVTPATSTP